MSSIDLEYYRMLNKINCKNQPGDVKESAKPMKNVNTQGCAGLRMEKLRLPTFSGDIREYVRFKYDFEKYEKNRDNWLVDYKLFHYTHRMSTQLLACVILQ